MAQCKLNYFSSDENVSSGETFRKHGILTFCDFLLYEEFARSKDFNSGSRNSFCCKTLKFGVLGELTFIVK